MAQTTIDTPRTAKHERWGFLCGATMALGASLSFAAARAGVLGGLLTVDMIFCLRIPAAAGLLVLRQDAPGNNILRQVRRPAKRQAGRAVARLRSPS